MRFGKRPFENIARKGEKGENADNLSQKLDKDKDGDLRHSLITVLLDDLKIYTSFEEFSSNFKHNL